MRFSFWPTPMLPFQETLSLAQHVESTDWDGIWLADHFMPNAENTSAPWPEAWTTLSALAASVPRVRLGTLVAGKLGAVVPVPAAAWLLGSGLIGLAAVARRRV